MLILSFGIILWLLSFFDSVFTNRFKKVVIFIVCITFVCLGGFRWNTGTDWDPYYYGFLSLNSYQDVISKYSFEWGFSMLNFIVRFLGGGYTFFLLIFTLLKVSLKYHFIVRREFIGYGLLSIFFYYCYFFGDIVTTRQSLAISLTFFSTIFIARKQLLYFLICVILASTIHKTAVFFIVSYYFYHKDFSRNTLIYTFCISLFLGLVLFNYNLTSFLSNLPIINSFSSFQEKIESYSKLGQVTYGEIDSTTTIILGYLKKVFVVLPILICYSLFKDNRVMRGMINLIVLGGVMYFVLGSLSSEFKRINGYFEIYEILIIPYFANNIKTKKLRLVIIQLYSLYGLYRLYTAFVMYSDLYDPFYTIFDLNNYRFIY